MRKTSSRPTFWQKRYRAAIWVPSKSIGQAPLRATSAVAGSDDANAGVPKGELVGVAAGLSSTESAESSITQPREDRSPDAKEYEIVSTTQPRYASHSPGALEQNSDKLLASQKLTKAPHKEGQAPIRERFARALNDKKLNQNYAFTTLIVCCFLLFIAGANTGGVLLFLLVFAMFIANIVGPVSKDDK